MQAFWRGRNSEDSEEKVKRMRCPVCESSHSKVTNVRHKEYKTYRRRKCECCGEDFTTYEVSTPMLMEIFEDQFSKETTRKIAEILDQEFPERRRCSDLY